MYCYLLVKYVLKYLHFSNINQIKAQLKYTITLVSLFKIDVKANKNVLSFSKQLFHFQLRDV